MLEVCGSSKTNYIKCVYSTDYSQSGDRILNRRVAWFSSGHPGEQWKELPPRSTALLEKLTLQHLANSQHFMEPQGSLPYSQQLFLVSHNSSAFGSFSLPTTTIKSVAMETQWGTFGFVLLDMSLSTIEKNYKCFHGNSTTTSRFCLRHIHCSVLMHTKDAISNGPNWGTNTKV
jgi:hypothetical protein